MYINKRLLSLNLIIILVLLANFRRLTIFYYIPIIIYFFTVYISHKYNNFKINRKFIYYYLYLAYTLFVIIWSFIYMRSLTAPLVGIPRILLMLALCQIIYWHIRSDYDVILILKIILFCYLIGALSLCYQAYFGPISWFAGMAGRGGLIRYSSILGSLTIFGSINGYAYILLFSSFISKNNIFLPFFWIVLAGWPPINIYFWIPYDSIA